MSEDIPRFSEAALARQAAVAAKKALGQPIGWADMAGILEPNPDLPDCPSEDIDSGAVCTLPHHHEGPHRAQIEW